MGQCKRCVCSVAVFVSFKDLQLTSCLTVSIFTLPVLQDKDLQDLSQGIWSKQTIFILFIYLTRCTVLSVCSVTLIYNLFKRLK